MRLLNLLLKGIYKLFITSVVAMVSSYELSKDLPANLSPSSSSETMINL